MLRRARELRSGRASRPRLEWARLRAASQADPGPSGKPAEFARPVRIPKIRQDGRRAAKLSRLCGQYAARRFYYSR